MKYFLLGTITHFFMELDKVLGGDGGSYWIEYNIQNFFVNCKLSNKERKGVCTDYVIVVLSAFVWS